MLLPPAPTPRACAPTSVSRWTDRHHLQWWQAAAGQHSSYSAHLKARWNNFHEHYTETPQKVAHTAQGNSPRAAPCLFPSLRLEMLFISAGMATIPTVEMIKGFADFPAESKQAKGLFLLSGGGGFVPMQSCSRGYLLLLAS